MKDNGENFERLLARNHLESKPWSKSVDYEALADVINKSRLADGVDDMITTAEDLTAQFHEPKEFVPERDITLIDREGDLVGCCRMHWEDRLNGELVFFHSVELIPEARGKGVMKALFLSNERHIGEIASSVARPRQKCSLVIWVNDEPNEWRAIARRDRGYKPVQHVVSMTRPLKDLPSVALPKGFEIRPVPPDMYEEVWKARRTACMNEWDFTESEWDRRRYKMWLKSEEFQPQLWQVAYHGDVLAGMILNFILGSENKEYRRKRGHTEHVYVAAQFRRKGLAKALLASSFRVLKAKGMEEAALDTEVENQNETVRLYGSMGFKVIHSFTFYQKAI